MADGGAGAAGSAPGDTAQAGYLDANQNKVFPRAHGAHGSGRVAPNVSVEAESPPGRAVHGPSWPAPRGAAASSSPGAILPEPPFIGYPEQYAFLEAAAAAAPRGRAARKKSGESRRPAEAAPWAALGPHPQAVFQARAPQPPGPARQPHAHAPAGVVGHLQPHEAVIQYRRYAAGEPVFVRQAATPDSRWVRGLVEAEYVAAEWYLVWVGDRKDIRPAHHIRPASEARQRQQHLLLPQGLQGHAGF